METPAPRLLPDAKALRRLLAHYVLHTDAPAEEERAFAAFTRESVARVMVGMSALLGASVLLLWPFDGLIFGGSPRLVALYQSWRPTTAALMATAVVLVLGVRPLRRWAYEVALLLAGLAMWNSAYHFSGFDGLDGPFMWLSYDFQFVLVPILVSLPRRIGGTLWLHACFVLGALMAHPDLRHHRFFGFFVLAGGLVDFANVVFGHIVYHLARRNFFQRRQLAEANAKSERLLLNILPAPIAERLKEEPGAIADRFGEVTVLFADICGFTPLSESMPPEGLVKLLNELFSRFDALVERHGLEKIKTIGDAYMVAGGLPSPRADHAQAVAELALEMAEAAASCKAPDGRTVELRIGVHSGPVVAGVIGLKKFSYDLWGDTVNTASRMESHGVPGAVTISEATRTLLGPGYRCEDRGLLHVKGKGEMRLFLLTGRAADAAPAA